MKMIIKFGVLLGTFVIVGSPLTGRAETPKAKVKSKTAQTAAAAKNQATGTAISPGTNGHPNREIIYITREPVTGSLIPRVYRQYGRTLQTMYPITSYTNIEINRALGAGDVAGVLRYDPSITFRH